MVKTQGGVLVPGEVAREQRKERMRQMQDVLTAFPGGANSGFRNARELSQSLLPVPRQLFQNVEPKLEDFIAMMNDHRIQQAFKILSAPIIDAEWSVNASDTKIENFVATVLRPLDRTLRAASMNALLFGHQPFEQVWGFQDVTVPDLDNPKKKTVVKSALVQTRIEPREPWLVEYVMDTQTQKPVGFYYSNNRNQWEADKDEQALLNNNSQWKAFWFTHDAALQMSNPYGLPILERAFKPYVQIENAGMLWEIYMQTKAMPIIVATAPWGSILDDSNEYVNAQLYIAEQLDAQTQRGSILTRPSEFTEGEGAKDKWNLEYLLDDRRGDVFKDWMDTWIAELFAAFFLPYNAQFSNVSDLNNSLKLEIQQGIFSDLLQAMNERILAPLVRMNFGSKAFAELQGSDLTGTRSDLYERMMQFLFQFLTRQDRQEQMAKVDMTAIFTQLGIPLQNPEEQKKSAQAFSRFAHNEPLNDEDTGEIRKFYRALEALLDQEGQP